MKAKLLIGVLLISLFLLTGCDFSSNYRSSEMSSQSNLINQSAEYNLSKYYDCDEIRNILIYIPNFVPPEPKRIINWYTFNYYFIDEDNAKYNERNETEIIYFTNEDVKNYFLKECITKTKQNGTKR